MGEDGHRQHRRHGTAVDWGIVSIVSTVRVIRARGGHFGRPERRVQTMLTVLTQPSRGLFSLADAENTIDR
jgi:hypothetical protein